MLKHKMLLFILLFLLIPVYVSAEDFEYTIKAKVSVIDKEIEEEEFTFDLIDSDGNVVQTKKNDSEGNVVFDPITFTNTDLNYTIYDYDIGNTKHGYKIYRIKQQETDTGKYIYDTEESYVGVYLTENGSSEVHYLKNIEEAIDGWTYKANRDESKIYHATEEELEGQAYAALDYFEGTLTFFRDEEGKYYSGQMILYDNDTKYKYIYTDFEGDTLNAPWSGAAGIKKIIFEDPIRPKKMANKDLSEWGGSVLGGWFFSLDDLEEIENINLLDTSLADSFNSLFDYSKKLKSLDLSTWDTSNVEDMYSMFYYCESLEDINVDNFDTSKVVHMDSMFLRTKVKNVDPTVFDTSSLRRANGMFWYDDGIEGLDFSSWTISDWYGTAQIASTVPQLRFIDVSNFTYLPSNALAYDGKLTVLRLGSHYNDISTSFGDNYAYWFNISNNTLYDQNDLKNHLVNIKDLDAATYVSPRYNPEPSTFKNYYIVPVEDEITIDINNAQTKLSDIFTKVLSVNTEIEWEVEDPTIVEIKDGKLNPLKIGNTTIHATIEGREYILHIIVTKKNILINPDTGDKIIIISIISIISLLLGTYLYRKRI